MPCCVVLCCVVLALVGSAAKVVLVDQWYWPPRQALQALVIADMYPSRNRSCCFTSAVARSLADRSRCSESRQFEKDGMRYINREGRADGVEESDMSFAIRLTEVLQSWSPDSRYETHSVPDPRGER